MLKKFFHIYPGEGRKAFQFCLVAFLCALGAYAGATLCDGLFVEHVGTEGLPLAYLLTAVGMFPIATLLFAAFNRFSARSIFFAMIAVQTVFYAFTALQVMLFGESLSEIFWFTCKIGSNIFLFLILTGIWTFLDAYYGLQDAKRLYGLFNAAMILGAAVGGCAVALGPIGGIFWLTCLALLGGFVLAIWTSRRAPLVDDETFDLGVPQSLKKIFFSPFTLYLVLFSTLVLLLEVVTEFNAMESIAGAFSGDGITHFLGKARGWIYFGDVFMAIFVYGRLVRRLGINNLMLLTPLCFVLLFAIWPFSSGLAMGLFGLIAVEGVLVGIAENNFTLIMNGVPARLKAKIRVFVEYFVEPLGMLLGSLLLLLFESQSKWIGLGLAVFALVAVVLLRKAYPRAIFHHLVESTIQFDRSPRQWLANLSQKERRRSQEHLLASLQGSSAFVQIFSCRCLLEFRDGAVLQRLLTRLPDLESEAALEVLQLIQASPFGNDRMVLDRLRQWRCEIVRPSIDFYLARAGGLEETPSDLSHPLQRGAAILAKPEGGHLLKALLHSRDEEELCVGLVVMGLRGTPFHFSLMLPYLGHPSLRVRRTAMRTLAHLGSPSASSHAPLLIDQLQATHDRELRLSCLDTLGKIAGRDHLKKLIQASLHLRRQEKVQMEQILCKVGTPQALLEIACDVDLDDRCRVLAGRALGKIAPQVLKSELPSLVGKEINRAHFYTYHRQTIQRRYPQYDLSLLESSLEQSFNSVLYLSIHLLGVVGNLDDCDLLFFSLQSENQKIHSHAIESLEKISDGKIFRHLLPLIDDRPALEKLRLYLIRGMSPYSLPELLNRLQRSPSSTDSFIGSALKGELSLPGWQASEVRKSDHPLNFELVEA